MWKRLSGSVVEPASHSQAGSASIGATDRYIIGRSKSKASVIPDVAAALCLQGPVTHSQGLIWDAAPASQAGPMEWVECWGEERD